MCTSLNLVGWLVGLKFNPKPDQLKQMIVPAFWRKCSNSNKNSLYCSVYYLFDTSHFFFLLRKKTPMTNIPSNPKTTGKMLAPKFPISKTAAITIKIIPTNSAIFWNIILHMLISPRTLYRLSLERVSLCHNWREWQENRLNFYYFRTLVV
jgi:hypothetical protein